MVGGGTTTADKNIVFKSIARTNRRRLDNVKKKKTEGYWILIRGPRARALRVAPWGPSDCELS